MNYRHAFHAGNFADLVKHAALLALLERMTAGGPPLTVIDTHAGRGLYDLAGPDSLKSGEAEEGVVRLMAAASAPPGFGPLVAAVRRLNPRGPVRRYPGSPMLIADALRRTDSYMACELRPDEHAALAAALNGRPGVGPRLADGYAVAAAEAPRGPARDRQTLVLIDPPFEQPDDYRRIVETVGAVHVRDPGAVVLVWLPIKDLETLDSFLRDLEDELTAPITVAECRMRPLSDPMKMNGCALVQVGGPDISGIMASSCGWTAETLGAGGSARVYRLQND